MKTFSIILISIIFLVYACKDDDKPIITPPPTPDCTFNYTEPANNHDTTINLECHVSYKYLYPDRYDYLDPVFNPNNPNQIAYLRRDYEQPGAGCKMSCGYLTSVRERKDCSLLTPVTALTGA